MPASRSTPKSSDRFGGAWRWISGGRISRAERDGLEEVVGRAGRRAVHRGAGLREEVLDDHLLHVPVAGVGGGDRHERVDPIGDRLADAHEDPGGERDLEPAGGLERGQPTGGDLVGRAAVAVEVVPERLDHHPLAGRHGAQEGQVGLVERAGVGVGEQPVSSSTRRAAAARYSTVEPWPCSSSHAACHRVAILGSLAEREQRLVAAGGGAGAGDGEHLLRREVGRLEAGGRLGEGAVAAAVAAQHGERDEDLGREGDPPAVGVVAHGPGAGHQGGERQGGEVAVRVGRTSVGPVHGGTLSSA